MSIFERRKTEQPKKEEPKVDNSRRKFLKTAALGAAALAFAPELFAQDPVNKKIIVGSKEEYDRIMEEYKKNLARYDELRKDYEKQLADWEEENKDNLAVYNKALTEYKEKMGEFGKFCEKFHLDDPLTPENAIYRINKKEREEYKIDGMTYRNNLCAIILDSPFDSLDVDLIDELKSLKLIKSNDEIYYPHNSDNSKIFQCSGGHKEGDYFLTYVEKDKIFDNEGFKIHQRYGSSGELYGYSFNLKNFQNESIFEMSNDGFFYDKRIKNEKFRVYNDRPEPNIQTHPIVKYFLIAGNIYKAYSILQKHNVTKNLYFSLGTAFNKQGKRGGPLDSMKEDLVMNFFMKVPLPPNPIPDKPPKPKTTDKPPKPEELTELEGKISKPNIEFNPLYGCKFEPKSLSATAFRSGHELDPQAFGQKPYNMEVIMGTLEYPNGKGEELTVRKYIELTKDMSEEVKEKVFGPGHKWWDKEIEKMEGK